MPEWNRYPTIYSELKKLDLITGAGPVAWCRRYAKETTGEQHNRAAIEGNWYVDKQPFYNIWPSVADGFAKVTLEVPCEQLIAKLLGMPSAIEIRFVKNGPTKIRSMLIGKATDKETGGPSIGLWVDTGVTTDDGIAVLDYVFTPLRFGSTALDCIEQWNWIGCEDERSLLSSAFSVLVCLALVKDDPKFVNEVLLNKHEGTVPKEIALVKAREAGVNGWHVGRDIEVSPHYRRPHFAVRWCEKGRAVPKLVAVKGCMVKGHDITQVPTGYEDA